MDRGRLDLLAVLSSVQSSIVVADATRPDHPITYANEAFYLLTGYSRSEVVGRNCRFLQGPDSNPQVVAELRAAIAAGKSIRREILNYRKDGSSFWNNLAIDPIHDDEGRLTGFVSTQYEVDTALDAQAAHKETESRLNSIASHISGYIYRAVLRTDDVVEMEYFSPSLRRILGLSDTDTIGNFMDHVHPDDRQAAKNSVRKSAATMSVLNTEFRLVSASGAAQWFRSVAPPRRLGNGDIVWDGLAIEITAEKRWEGEVANLVLRDPLTNLLNRTAWRRALMAELTLDSAGPRDCGVLYIDIEAFHDLNKRHGQAGGDEILRETGERIARLATSIAGIAARLGSDEFAMLVPACGGDAALANLAGRVKAALEQPMPVNGRSTIIGTCIGAALSKDRDADALSNDTIAGELMAQAELAFGWAKQAGRGSPLVYSREQDDRFQNLATLSDALEQAIANDELELHYQPLVDLSSGRIVAVEALVRWNHPTLGMQRPDIFIPIAEASGLIGTLGQWVLAQAVRQRAIWQGAGLKPPRVSINVSGSQLVEPGFADQFRQTLAAQNARASDFKIELTEGVLIEPSPRVIASLHALRELGFKIAIDDFGSGHATFRYLRDFPIDEIKIDQTFVRKLVPASTDTLIIRAIISLARGMGVDLVAEGIETEMQRDLLQREGCLIGQGYLFSMPLVAEDLAWMLANDVRLPMRPPIEF